VEPVQAGFVNSLEVDPVRQGQAGVDEILERILEI
jgi:hypothetical protein